MLPDQNFRLTDAQMASFIAHGHITVTPDLPREFHAEVFAQHEEVFEKEGRGRISLFSSDRPYWFRHCN